MGKGQAIEGVRNLRSQQLFILLEDLAGRYKVINPQGETMVLSESIFAEPEIIEPDLLGKQFSVAQLAAHDNYIEEGAADLELQEKRQKEETTRPKKLPSPKATGQRRRKKTAISRRGLGAQWQSSRLIFYRHKIDPLDPLQTFRIHIDRLGMFEISKEAFLSEFNDVIISAKYRQEGMFIYEQFPEKGRKYLAAIPELSP